MAMERGVSVSIITFILSILAGVIANYVSKRLDERETDGDPDHPSWLPLSVMAKGVSSAEEVLEEARKELPASLDAESHVVVGMPSRKIVEFAAANGHDLIIMGGRGLSPVTGFLLGSVSQEVMEEAKCAVLVAK